MLLFRYYFSFLSRAVVIYTLMCNCVSIYANEAELGRFQIKAAAPPHQQIPNISHNKKIAGGLCYSLFLKFIFYYVVAGMFKTSPAHSFGAYSSCFISIVTPPSLLKYYSYLSRSVVGNIRKA